MTSWYTGYMNEIQAPRPIVLGQLITCPMVDVARVEVMAPEEAAQLSIPDMLCRWTGGNTPEGLEEYEEHFQKDHWEPFTAGTVMLLEAINGAVEYDE